MAEIAFTMFKGLALDRVINLINSYIDKHWEYLSANVKEKLEEMQSSFIEINSVLSLAERKKIEENPSLVKWLSDLKKAIYDAEDVMDVFESKRLKDKVDSYPENKVLKVRYYSKVLSACCFKIQENSTVIAKRLIFADEELNELLQVVKKLKSLVERMNSIATILNSYPDKERHELRQDATVDRVPTWQETTSVLAEPKLVGRDRVQKELIQKLLQSSDGSSEETRSFSIVSVVGVGGIGKTTLAQSVFNHEDVKKHFDVTAWVCVSTYFDNKSLMLRIVEAAIIISQENLNSLNSLESVQKVLIQSFQTKKFLVVLDDVWEDMEDKWRQIRATFNYGEKGSKILVTSRFRQVAHVMEAQDSMQIHLNPLEDYHFLDFFQQCASRHNKPDEYPILKKIGDKIAKKLGGLPLAAKTVGGVLSRDLNFDHWNSVLNNESWREENDAVMSALKLSYNYLPSHLKKCFAYCSLFPKDYWYDAETLGHIWITLNCIEPADKNKRLVDIQRKYIDDLVNRCFLEMRETIFGRNYVMHDLVHDLAEQIVGIEVYRVEDDDSLPKEVHAHCIRHLYVKSTKYNSLNSVLQKLAVAPKQIRSLIYVVNKDKLNEHKEEFKIIEEILPKLKGLWLLFLRGEKQMRLWKNELGDLLHLWCINFDISSYSSNHTTLDFPTFFWKLHPLEIFRLDFRGKAKELVGLHKLINLRYFQLQDMQNYDHEIITSYLGRLKSLEAVPGGKFIIVDGKDGNDIGQLGDLDKIGEDLTLLVRTKLSNQEAKNANLERKKYLTGMTINEECADEDGIEDNALSALQPHHGSLQNLKIQGCKSITKGPDWLSKLTILTKLHLLNLPKLQRLPPYLGNNLVALRNCI